ncbi:hypothetical protein B0H14DRAFT_2804100 [Mycena olivaceomarginata]|nr:hypothetical protein B0H14DRAFT_2804100 [Mycena olivaceomarginata]
MFSSDHTTIHRGNGGSGGPDAEGPQFTVSDAQNWGVNVAGDLWIDSEARNRSSGRLIQQSGTDVEHPRREVQAPHVVQVNNNIKQWLLSGVSTDPATDRNAALRRRQEGTGEWFLKTPAFRKWRSSGRGSVLWLHGPSGSGKTILSACVVEELLHSIPDLAYFFFGLKAKESLDGMLSSTLLQLASGPPSRSSLLTYFEMMLKVPRDLVLVVDALDEHPRPRNRLLEFLTGLSRNHHIRLLVASRDEDDIRAAMQDIDAAEIDLNGESKQKEDLVNRSPPHR